MNLNMNARLDLLDTKHFGRVWLRITGANGVLDGACSFHYFLIDHEPSRDLSGAQVPYSSLISPDAPTVGYIVERCGVGFGGAA
jgi:hypothetical protein